METADTAIDRLLLAQWLSPAFPIGSFAYSQGMESAMAAAELRDSATLARWIDPVLAHGSGRADAILIAHARQPGADIAHLDALARALAPSAERLAETLDQGAAFGRMIAAATGQPQPPLPYPLAVGLATRPLKVATQEVLALWLHGLAAMLVSAATRFLPLGQTEGQRLLAALAPRIVTLAARFAAAPLDEIHSATPRADLAAMQHETLQPRIFRT